VNALKVIVSVNREHARGNCYATSEAAYHLLGGRQSGWKPMVMRFKDDTHWFLKHESGMILDLTLNQFNGKIPDYSKARGCGFRTKNPSKKAKQLMEKMLWQK